jgi:hypothetical protein
VIVVDRAHGYNTAMEFSNLCDGLAEGGIVGEVNVEEFFDKEDLGERAEILMTFAECIEDVIASFQIPNKG